MPSNGMTYDSRITIRRFNRYSVADSGWRICRVVGPQRIGKNHVASSKLRSASRQRRRNPHFWKGPRRAGIGASLRDRLRWYRSSFELSFPFTVEEVVLLGRVPHRGALSLRPRHRSHRRGRGHASRPGVRSTRPTHA